MSRIVLLATLAIGLLSIPNTASHAGEGNSKPVIELMPRDSLVTIHVSSIPEMLKTISASDFGDLWSDPDVQLFVKPIWEAATEEYGQLRAGMPFLPQPKVLQQVFDGDAAIAVQASDAGIEKPAFCAAFKIGDAKAAAKLFAPLLRGGPLTAGKVTPLGPPGGPAFVFEKNILMLASTGKTLASLQAKLNTPTPKTDLLPNSKPWLATQKLLKTKGLVTVFANAESGLKIFLENVQKKNPAELEKIKGVIANTGLDGVTGLAMQFSQRKDVLAFDLAMSIDPTVPPKGIIADMLKTKPIPASALKIVPVNSTFVSAGRVNLTDSLTLIRSLIPAEEKNEFEAGLTKVQAMIGVNLEKDIIPLFGETWIAYDCGGVEFMGLLPSIALSIELKNNVKAAATLEKTTQSILQFAMQQAGPHGPKVDLKEVNIGKRKVQYLNLPFFPISPAWVTTKDKILVTMSVSGMRKALKQLDASTDISSAPNFKVAMERITGKPLTLSALPGQFTFSNTSTVESGKSSFTSVATFGKFMVDGGKMSFKQRRAWRGQISPQDQAILNILETIDLALFPSDETILKYIKPTATVALTSKNGVVFRSDLSIPSPSAMGSGQGGIFVVPVMAASLWFLSWRHRVLP